MKPGFQKFLSVLAFLCFISRAFAQQDAQYTQFMYNKLPQNAAYTGSREGLTIRASYRDQWSGKRKTGLEGAPKTTTFSIHSPLKRQSFALGFYFVNDRLGLEHKNQFDVTYSYKISAGKKIKISFGVNAGILWYKLNASDAILIKQDDPSYVNVNRVLPDIGAGVYIYHPNFYVGASIPNCVRGNLSNKGQESSAKRSPHFVMMAGGIIPLGKSLNLRPQMQYCYLGSTIYKIPHTFDFNLSLMIYDRVNVGAQYHGTFNNKNKGEKLDNPDSIDMMLEVWPTKQLMIGYSYDYTISKTSAYKKGSHEVMIGYDIPSKKPKGSPLQCYRF